MSVAVDRSISGGALITAPLAGGGDVALTPGLLPEVLPGGFTW